MQIIAILVAALSNFALGALWYSPLLFCKVWQLEAGLSDAQIKENGEKHGPKPFIYSFIYAVLAAIGFSILTKHTHSLSENIYLGLIVGVLFVATSLGVNYQFANRSNKLFLIDAGYHAIQFIIYAIIFWYI